MRLTPIAAMAWAVLIGTTAAWGQDFRVETDVFLDNREKSAPAAQYLTLFVGGRVYDFMYEEPKEIIIYDVKGERFLLLAPDRREQATLTCEQLLQFTAAIQAQATQSRDEDIRFLANPSFDVRHDPSTQRVTLASKRLQYAAIPSAVAPPNDGVVRRYRNFADWYARMNGVRFGNMPPFARMELNAQLESRGLIPGEVIKTMHPRAVFDKETEVRSKHLFTWRVLPSDQKRIEEADSYLSTFKHVEPGVYLKWPARTAKKTN